ncbi:amidohydrolase family protein [Aspergillus eucalypticola CBS 122712]|uniref:Amidohydrolase family protein n=1 Tax=Aspergillus eucalypticola (strain CBS 122712 / IBT 29274) TaxID=1448314 RepID=A0A317V4H8_ASPEC|nr:amidohydrolase family protein [Aspergillus eucalypticola CBS 122712]PWY67747.1 amidohydrolase family protein [Aspergillus eucalypticola CBS 122712]
MPTPIIDSHIHLFPASHLPTLAWYTPSSPLGSQHSIDEYRLATTSTPTSPEETTPTKTNPHYLRGFIFLETDRISSIEESDPTRGWSHALDEVSFLTRIITGDPIPGEGHKDVDRHLCLGMVPWAPVPGGPAALEKYISLVRERTRTEEVFKKVRGVRYLVQDKPSGVMLKPEFIDGLKWLGRQQLAFDLGVDARQGGMWQLREAAEMMNTVYRGVGEKKDRVRIVINHLCKPNLRLPYTSPDSIATHPDFLEWSSLITAMAQHPTAYMKLSGGFSELLPLTADSEPDIASLVDQVQLWTDVVFDAFGPERVMFGSDWPVCNVGGGGNTVAWRRWRSVVEGILEKRGLSQEQKEGVWGGVALKAYGIES